MTTTYKRHLARQSARRITAERLADLLNVSLRTAQRYRSGDSKPPTAALRLIELELSGHILPENWAKLGLTFNADNELITPSGTLRAGMVSQHDWFLKNYRSLLSQTEKIQRQLDAIWPVITPAQKLQLIPMRHALPKRRTSSL